MGTLSLTPDTEVKNLPSESKRKGFKFELWTTSPQGHRKVNRFKVSQQGLSRFDDTSAYSQYSQYIGFNLGFNFIGSRSYCMSKKHSFFLLFF